MEAVQEEARVEVREEQEARNELQVLLFLSISMLKRTGGARASTSREPSNPLVQRVHTLINSIGRCWGPFEKQIMASDLRKDQSRLILPMGQVKKFVNSLGKEGLDPAESKEVTVFNTEGEPFPMRFKLWHSKGYVLMGGWNRFVEANPLEQSKIFKIWAFCQEQTQNLCFVISAVAG